MSDEAGDANTSVTVPGTGTSLALGDLKASIAAELAAELCSPEDVRKRYGLSPSQWKALKANPMFRGMMRDAIATFRGPLAAGARITKKAEILLEDVMPELYSVAKANDVPTSERINAIKTLADLAGRSAKAQTPVAAGGGGFQLTINVGGKQGITIDGTTVPTEE